MAITTITLTEKQNGAGPYFNVESSTDCINYSSSVSNPIYLPTIGSTATASVLDEYVCLRLTSTGLCTNSEIISESIDYISCCDISSSITIPDENINTFATFTVSRGSCGSLNSNAWLFSSSYDNQITDGIYDNYEYAILEEYKDTEFICNPPQPKDSEIPYLIESGGVVVGAKGW